jgi:hypothetical protein
MAEPGVVAALHFGILGAKAPQVYQGCHLLMAHLGFKIASACMLNKWEINSWYSTMNL